MQASGFESIADRYAVATGARPVYLLRRGGLFAVRWRVPRHRTTSVWAPHDVLGYRAGGIATIRRRCGECEVRKVPVLGSVSFSPGDAPIEWSSDAPIETIHIYIAAGALRSFAEENLESASAPRVRDFFGIQDPWLTAYFRLLDSECALYPDGLLLDHTRHVLLRHLVGHYSETGGAVARAERLRVAPLRRGVRRRIEEYIDMNLTCDVSLQTLARVAQMSADHFLRAFRAATGTTPHRFVLDQRLAKASAMLRTGTGTVADIAKCCGFRNAAHFSVRFRARFGVTPSEYRRAR